MRHPSATVLHLIVWPAITAAIAILPRIPSPAQPWGASAAEAPLGSPVAAVTQGSTWPAGYSIRRPITITTGPNSPAGGYAGYTVRLTGFDTASEVAEGDMRADGNDLRIFYWTGTGWVEVPRLATGFGSADTHVIFKLQTDIPANSANTDHYIFYGNPGAGAPEALSSTNVYLWYDDFASDPFLGAPRYTRAKAVDIHGADYVLPLYDAVNGRVIWDTGDNATAEMYVNNVGFAAAEQDILVAVDHDGDRDYPANATDAIVVRTSDISTSSTHVYLHYSHGNYPDSPAIAWDTWTNGERNDLGGSLRRVFWPFNSPRTWSFAVFGTTAKFWDDGDLDPEPWFDGEPALLTGSTTPPQTGYVGLGPGQSRGWWDNLIVRRYTEPEPTTSFAAEEVLTAGVVISKAVVPAGTVTPGSDLTYTITITSAGNADAVDVVVVDSLAAEVEFKLGSVVTNLPTGIGVTTEYSNDGGSAWGYTPVSTGCGAPPGYDGCVTHIRWSLLDDFPADPPDNSGTLEFGARIR
jgi:uncharacterized repeat protein (TIGR01451 family)